MPLASRKHKRRHDRTKRQARSITFRVLVGLFVMFIFAGLAFAVWYVTRLPMFTITEITVDGGKTISHSEIDAIVARELTGNYLALVPHRFTYLYPKERIETALSTEPRMYDVRVGKKDAKTLYVTFKEYIPQALWCGGADDAAPCFFITTEGYAFYEAPPLRGGAFVRHITEGRTPQLRANVFSSSEMERMQLFIDALLREFEFRVSAVVHTIDGDEQYVLSNGGEIRINPNEDTQTTFDNLRSLISSEEYQHLRTDYFQYIDLRFGDRLFVNETDPSISVATSTATSTESEALDVEADQPLE